MWTLKRQFYSSTVGFSKSVLLQYVCVIKTAGSCPRAYPFGPGRRGWSRRRAGRRGWGQRFCGPPLPPHNRRCRCRRRNTPRCQCAGARPRRSAHGSPPRSPGAPYPWRWRLKTANTTKLRGFKFQNKSCVMWLRDGILICWGFIHWGGVYYAGVALVNRHIAADVDMSDVPLTHLRCRGRARPGWRGWGGVCSSAEGPADRGFEVSRVLAPPLGSWPAPFKTDGFRDRSEAVAILRFTDGETIFKPLDYSPEEKCFIFSKQMSFDNWKRKLCFFSVIRCPSVKKTLAGSLC